MKTPYLLTALAAIALSSFHSDLTRKQLNKANQAAIVTATPLQIKMAADTGDLPASYKKRKFLPGALQMETDLTKLPGNIVKYNPADSSYEFKTIKAIIKGDKPALSTTITDGLLFSGQVTPKTSFNGSYLIGGIQANSNQIMELSIQDQDRAFVPDSLVDIARIKEISQSIPAGDLNNYFYLKSVTLSYIRYRKYTLSKFDITKNLYYITADGKAYSSSSKFLTEKIVTMYAIPLANLMNAVK